MKVSRSFIAITVAFSLAMLPSAIAVDKTSSRSAGPTPTTVVNTILSGAGIPSKTLGINGDFYIDTKNLNLYGPKSKGVWKVSTSLRANEVPVIANVIGEPGAMGQTGAKGATGATGARGETGLQGLQGPQGLQGVQGVQGTKGDNGINGSTGATGTQGVQGTKGDDGTNGAQGIQGLQGLTGAAGTNGLTGAQGLPGLQGATGVTGNSGATGATGGQGVKGDTGLTGATGGQGSQGATGGQGAKGDTGLTGAAGSSTTTVSYFVDLGTWTLATNQNLGSSDSSGFITLDAGSYTFNISVDGTFAPEASEAMFIGMQVIGSSGSVDYQVFVSDTKAFINGVGRRHLQFFIIGKIVTDVASTLKLRAIDQFGATSGSMLNFKGRALVNKVGSIG